MTFRVLTVCTGNVCRSPMAERLLRAGLGDGVEVISAGTGALVGEPMTAPTRALVTRHGGDAERHAARQLTPELVAGADLVLAMTRRHRGTVLTTLPRAVQFTFTLREAARLASAVDPASLPPGPCEARLRAALPALRAARGHLPPPDPADDDVPDPYRRPDAVYEAMAAVLVPAVDAIVALASPPD